MNQIKTNTLLLIQELFVTKNWNLRSGNLITPSLYDKYCERLRLLNDQQQLLIIELSYKYTWIELQSYLERIYDSLILLGDDIFNNYNKIFVYPLLNPSRASPSQTKSAGFIHYMFESDDYTWLSNKLIPHFSSQFLNFNFDNQDSILILLDDFVGSGETAIEICNEYLKILTKDGKVKPENIKVVSIAAQQQGINALMKTLSIEVISALIFEKGISDKYTGTEKDIKLKLMEEIENTLKIKDEFKFGFRKTEALLTMLNKTPNNTFPVYWMETKNKVAPFPRKKKYRVHG